MSTGRIGLFGGGACGWPSWVVCAVAALPGMANATEGARCRHAFVSAACFASESWLAWPATVAGIALGGVALWAWRRRAPSRRALWGVGLALVLLAHGAMLVVLHQPGLRPPADGAGGVAAYAYPVLIVMAVVAHALLLVRFAWQRGARGRGAGA